MKKTKVWSVKMRLALMALAALVWIAVPMSARAEGTVDVWDGSTATGFAGGDGSKDNPYQISSAEELAYLAQQVNGGNRYNGEYIVLKNDINLNNEEWTPIGGNGCPFQGTFNGDNHTVTGMQISGSSNYVGLFGKCTRFNDLSGIKNITIEHSSVSGTNYVGAIVGYADNVGISNCRSIGNEIKGTERVGGIGGNISGSNYNSTVSQCYNNSTVSGKRYVGGIAGYGDRCTTTNCLNAGNIETTERKDNYMGGIFGMFSNSNNNRNITACVNVGNISGWENLGEIVGEWQGTLSVSDCYYNSDTARTGGIGNQEDVDGVTPLTTVVLCGDLPVGLNSEAWNAGSIGEIVPDSDNSDFGTRKVNYPYPKSVGEVEVEQKVYNFGTEADYDWEPYISIKDEGDLYGFNFGPDEIYWKIDYTKNYVLNENICFSDAYAISPIGDESHPFTGKFSGNGHTISNVYLEDSDASYVGLFGYCDDTSVIKDLTVSNSIITGTSCVGAIAGRAGNIIGCKSLDNTVTGSSLAVGGICGWADGKVSNCYNDSTVTGDIEVGGICGYFNTKDSATLSQCVSLGKVSAKGNNIDNFAGGIVGYLSDNAGSVTACYYDSDIVGTAVNTVSGVTPLTTVQLCGTLPKGLDAAFWNEGGIGTATAREGRFGDAEGTYLSPKSMETARSAGKIPMYNFATTGGDDWDTYARITTAEEFAAIGRDDTKWSGNYVLGNNIDVSGVQLSPIGDPGTPYTGKFSGDGHTISNINMTGVCWGLFGGLGNINGQIAESGKVMLLAANGVIASNTDAGGICGYLLNGEIYGCSFIGTVKGVTAGGICSQSGVYDKISQCFFAGEVQGSLGAAGICGNSGSIDHCISIGNVKGNGELAGISNSGDPDRENCYFNKDICNVKDDYDLGRSTMQLTSSSFFEELKANGFDLAIWTKKANDKETGTAYYPSLGENNAVSVDYTTGLQFERADDAAPTYGQDITFNVKALVNFVTDGQPIPAEDTDGSFEIRIEDTPVVNAAEFWDGTATYNARTAGETPFTLVYTGTNSSFFPEQTTKDLTVNIAPAALTVEGKGIAGGTYGDKLSQLTVTGLTAKLGTGIIDGTWQIQSDDDKVPYVGDSETYTATFIPEYPEYYQSLTAPVTLKIEKARAPKINSLNLEYSWAAKGERAVQIPGLPDAMGETTMDVEMIAGLSSILTTDPDIKYSEGKLLFTLGENTMEDIGQKVLVTVRIHPQNYGDFYLDINIFRTAKSDREAPASDAFDMTFTVSGNDLAAEVTTDLTDAEYSFDGTDFGPTKATRVGHDEKVTAWMRYAETDDYNASPAISKTWNSGHGTLTHHDRVEPTCQAEGSIEYWTCDVCGLYFATADGSERITAAETVLPKTEHSWSEDYLSDMTGHWHKCSSCGATTNTESHISGGAATTEQAEICTVCGYEIAPKKPADNNNGNDNTGDNGGSNTPNGDNGGSNTPGGDNGGSNTPNGDNGGSNTPGGDNNGSDTPNGSNNGGTVSGNDANSNTGSSDTDDDDDDDDQTPSSDQKPADAGTTSAGGTTNSATAGKPSAPGAGKPSVTPVTPTPTTPAADEGRKDDAAKPSGEAQDTQEAGGDASREERTDSMTAQTSGTQEPGTEQLTETSGKGTNAGRVAAAAAAGTVAVGGGGAAIYVTIKKGRFKFK